MTTHIYFRCFETLHLHFLTSRLEFPTRLDRRSAMKRVVWSCLGSGATVCLGSGAVWGLELFGVWG
jgi:hypothetical protein